MNSSPHFSHRCRQHILMELLSLVMLPWDKLMHKKEQEEILVSFSNSSKLTECSHTMHLKCVACVLARFNHIFILSSNKYYLRVITLIDRPYWSCFNACWYDTLLPAKHISIQFKLRPSLCSLSKLRKTFVRQLSLNFEPCT